MISPIPKPPERGREEAAVRGVWSSKRSGGQTLPGLQGAGARDQPGPSALLEENKRPPLMNEEACVSRRYAEKG